MNAKLDVGAVTETVEVVAGNTLIQSTPQVQSLMGPTQLQELPLNNRNFVQLATLVPGVNSSLPDEVGIGLTNVVSVSIAGNRRNSVNWLVDGASNVDVGSNVTLLATPTLESIEEFKIITSGYNAEWPRSGGGIINIVTKSGSNVFRGSGYEFFRDDKLNANSFFRNQSTDPETNGKAPALDYNNFGYTIGGPLLRDNLFFFFSQEWRQISRAPASTLATVIDPAWLNDPSNPNYVAPADRDPNAVRLLAAWPAANLGANSYQDSRPNDQDTRQEVIRMDYQMGANWRLMGRYTHDLSETTETGGLFFNTTIPNIATTLTNVPGHIFVAQLTTTLSSTMLNELSFQFSGNAIKSEYGENAINTRGAFNLTIPELFPENRNDLVPSIDLSNQATTIGAPQLFDNKYRNYTISDNLSWQRGSHALKAGFLFAFEQKNEISGSETQGRFVFAAAGGRTAFQNFMLGNRDGVCGVSCTYTEPGVEVDSQFRFNRYEFYVQDSWRLRSNVTLDYGLRYALYPAGHGQKRRAHELRSGCLPAQRGADAQRGRHRCRWNGRSAQRHHRRRSELTPRERDLPERQEQLPAPCRLLVGHVLRFEDGDARRLRDLLRPAAHRHLSAERVRQSAVRGEPAGAECAAVESGLRHHADHPAGAPT